jgi:predicted nucleic acid-binding protein
LIELTTSIRKRAIELRQKNKISTPDAIIVATAWELGLPLLTADKAIAKLEGVEIILLN